MKNKLIFITLGLNFYFSNIALSQTNNYPSNNNLESGMPEWGIVFGGDKNIKEARREIERAAKLSYQNPTLFYKSGWYRSVILYNSEDKAQKSLSAIHKNLRRGSYLVNIKQWCPYGIFSSRQDQNIKYYQC